MSIRANHGVKRITIFSGYAFRVSRMRLGTEPSVNFRSRIVLAAMLSVSGLIALAAIIVGHRLTAEHRLDMLEDRARAGAEIIDEHLAANLRALEFCASSPHLVGAIDLARFEDECGRLLDLIGSWIVLIEVGPVHRQIVNSRVRDGASLPSPYPRQEERATLLALEARSRAEGVALVSDAFLGRAANMPVLTAGRFVTLADGREAMAYSGVDPRRLSAMLAAIAPADDDHLPGDIFLGAVDGAFRAIARSEGFDERAGVAAPAWFRTLAASPDTRLSGVPGPLADDPELDIAIARPANAQNWIVWAGRWRQKSAAVVDVLMAWPLALALIAGLLSSGGLHLWSVAERRRQRLLAAEATLAAAERAEDERTSMMTALAHQVRSPLTSLLGALELGRGADRPELAAAAARAGEAVLQRIDDMLELAYLRSGAICLHPTPTDVIEALRSVLARHEPQARAKGMTVTLDTPSEGLPILTVDRLRLEQIIDSLVDNALTHADAGAVTVGVRLHEAAGSTPELEVSVRDEGPGVPASRREAIFQDFESAEPVGGVASRGVGLGLPIARRLARAMDGDVVLADSVEGADFRVRLPLPIAGVAQTSGDGTPLSGLVVVLAEDEPVIREITLQRLRDAGAEVVETADGAEALAAVRLLRPDVALLDIEMPVLDGVEAARRIRAEPGLDGVAVLGLTSHVGGAKAASARAAGMDEVMTKPLQILPMAAAIRARRGLSGRLDRSGRRGVVASPPAPRLVDPEVFDALAALPGDRLASDLLPRFEAEGFAKLDEIAALLRENDAARAAEVAHQLKGPVQNICMRCNGREDLLVRASNAATSPPDAPGGSGHIPRCLFRLFVSAASPG